MFLLTVFEQRIGGAKGGWTESFIQTAADICEITASSEHFMGKTRAT